MSALADARVPPPAAALTSHGFARRASCDHRRVELSGWQTVAISLGGAAITGAAVFLVAFVSGRQARKQLERRLEHERRQQAERLAHERDERWTERLVCAADDFATGLDQAILGIRDMITADRKKRDIDALSREAERRVQEAVARLARIRLLFGQDTVVTRPAEDVLVELELARGAAANPDPTFAWEKLDKVYRLRDRFQAEAIAVMHGLPDGSSGTA